MMYGMIAVFSGLSIMCMEAFPRTTNYMMFFMPVFMIVIYEKIVPIVLQCTISCVCMAYFYSRYTEQLNGSWGIDAMWMSLVYIVSALFVFTAMCMLSKESVEKLKKVNEESNEAKNKAEGLLG
jgi:methyl-accepting chemotaxis protein